MDTLQLGCHMSRPSSPSTSYDPRDNNRRIQTSRDVLQSARFSTSYDLRDNNRRTQTPEYGCLGGG
jgi:hypothetical protein